MTNPTIDDVQTLRQKAAARGLAHAELALNGGMSPASQHALLSAAYFTIADGLRKVRITE